MADRYLVVGGLGLVGRALLGELARVGVEAVGLSRRAPGSELTQPWIQADLTDLAACEAALAGYPTGYFSHVVYCALFEQPELVQGWQDAAQIATNERMLRNLLDCVQPSQHLTLLQGTKAYGAHLRPMALPGKEGSPRPEGPNFYWQQEDLARVRQAAEGWGLTILRPQVVCGLALGSPMNLAAALGAHAALCRHLNEPFSYPGAGEFVTEAVDAELLARAAIWAGSTPRANGETYNVTNGDVVHWPSIWPELAAQLNVDVGEAAAYSLRHRFDGAAAAWRDLAERADLAVPELADLVGASGQFADAVLGVGGGRSTLLSTIKIREHGFGECVDTLDMFARHFDAMRRARWLP